MRVDRFRIVLWTAVAVLLLILAGCASLDSKMTLHKDGQWDCIFDVIVDRETMDLYGQDEADLEASLVKEFGPAGSKHEEEGVTFTWRKTRSDDDSIVIRLTMSGKDFASLESIGASVEPTIGPNGRKAFAFETDSDTFSEFGRASLTLDAGKILDSNADRVSGGTAEWDDLSRGQTAVATVTGARRLSAGIILGALAILGILVAGAVLLSASQRQRQVAAVGVEIQPVTPQPSQFAPAPRRFCTACGEPLTPGASFCMKCGARVASPHSQGG